METGNRYVVLVFGIGLLFVLVLGMGGQGTAAKDANQPLPHVASADVIDSTQVAGNLNWGHTWGVTSTLTFTTYLPAVYWNLASPYIEKIYATPDYFQLDPAYGGLPGSGGMYCAPVAASNSLMWLDDNGYDDLAPNTSDRKKDQFDLIVLLGSSNYMNTSLEIGTGVNSLLNGLDKFIQDKGYQYVRLQYQGWRYHQSKFSTGVSVPNLSWIRQGVEGYNSAWLNYGRYSYDAASDEYRRSGGHWVTLVGYGYDNSLATPTYLIVHDPAWGDGSSITNLYLFLERIDSGTLVGDYTGLPKSAVGFYKVTVSTSPGASGAGRDMPVASASESASLIILDGVVVLEMPTSARAVSVDTPSAMPNPANEYVNEGD